MITFRKKNSIANAAMSSGSPLIYETHSHTKMCRHAIGEAEAYCERAIRVGLAGIVFTEHNPMMPQYSHQERLHPGELGEYVELVKSLQKKYASVLDVRLGLEFDYLPEYNEFIRKQKESVPGIQYSLGSVHCQFQEFLDHVDPRTSDNFLRVYYDCLGSSAESGLFDCIAHPHLAAALLDMHEAPPAPYVDRFLRRLKRVGAALELNTSGARYWDHYTYEKANALGIPICIAGDAHAPAHVGAYFAYALEFLADVGCEEVATIIDGKPRFTPLLQARELISTSTYV